MEDKIGEIFTPLRWARWLIGKWGVLERWRDGASVCDPTAGAGVFARALFDEAQRRGVTVTDAMLHRLHLIELQRGYLYSILRIAKREYGLAFPASSLHCLDVITETPKMRFDILVGNPPWANFTDLPAHYKEMLKPYFIAAGLVPNRKAALLGSSRTDIAALVLTVVFGHLSKEGGSAHFFAPLSLFTGDDAHRGFRDYRAFATHFSVQSVFEFNRSNLFAGVSTAYCCASFLIGKEQIFPVPYFRESALGWKKFTAVPLKALSDQWRVIDAHAQRRHTDAINVPLAFNQKPRQGVNTCGANSIFIFDAPPKSVDQRFIFPLATNALWNGGVSRVQKWVFLPYDPDSGRPLRYERIKDMLGCDYLGQHKSALEARNGTLIQGAIRKGMWWALLGVGPYSFAPYKIVWQSYGKKEFKPILLSHINGQVWQGNQAMHAFIPCWSLSNARHILKSLQNPRISELLEQLNGCGKCNWAQPGKVQKVLAFDAAPSATLFAKEA